MSDPKQPLISLVTATMNRGGMLDELLSSVTAQSYQNWEVIIVDNGSTDTTDEVIAKHKKAVSQTITHIKLNENVGFTRGVHRGIVESNGEIVGFLGDDDLLEPTWFSQAIEVFKTHENAELVYGNVWKGAEPGERTHFPVGYTGLNGETLSLKAFAEVMLNGQMFCTIGVLFSRAAYDRSGGLYTEPQYDYIQDTDLWRRMMETTHAYYVPAIVGFSREHDDNITSTKKIPFMLTAESYWSEVLTNETDADTTRMVHQYLAKRLLEGAFFFSQQAHFERPRIRYYVSRAWRYHRYYVLSLMYLLASVLPAGFTEFLMATKHRIKPPKKDAHYFTAATTADGQ